MLELKRSKTQSHKGDIRVPREIRKCTYPGCINTFKTRITSNKKYCSVRQHNVPKEIRICAYEKCKNEFEVFCTSERKYCTSGCAGRQNGDNKKMEIITRVCAREECDNTFTCIETIPQKFCSKNCTNLSASQRIITKEERRKRSTAAKANWKKKGYREKVISRATQALNRPEVKKKRSKALKKWWANPVNKKKQLEAIFKGRDINPNNVEQKLMSLLDFLYPEEWKFVGDGKVWINGKCPDFINSSNTKLIEMFGDYWHSEEVTGLPMKQHVKERKAIFTSTGYEVLIIWEHELEGDLQQVKQRISSFCEAA